MLMCAYVAVVIGCDYNNFGVLDSFTFIGNYETVYEKFGENMYIKQWTWYSLELFRIKSENYAI